MQMDGLTIRLEERQYEALKELAARENLKPRTLARLLIREGLQRLGYVVGDNDDLALSDGRKRSNHGVVPTRTQRESGIEVEDNQ